MRSGRQYCTPHKIGYEVLESIILGDLKVMLQNKDNLKALVTGEVGSVAASDSREAAKITIQAELEKVRKLKKAVYEDYREELISKEEFVSYRQDYAQKEELLVRQLLCVEKKTGSAGENVFDTAWFQRLLEHREVEKLDRAVVVEMLHEIKVYENHRVKITYNFSGEMAPLFADIVDG